MTLVCIALTSCSNSKEEEYIEKVTKVDKDYRPRGIIYKDYNTYSYDTIFYKYVMTDKKLQNLYKHFYVETIDLNKFCIKHKYNYVDVMYVAWTHYWDSERNIGNLSNYQIYYSENTKKLVLESMVESFRDRSKYFYTYTGDIGEGYIKGYTLIIRTLEKYYKSTTAKGLFIKHEMY